MTVEILTGCVNDVLPTLEEKRFRCCVTSPPYWGLRDYGVEGQLGLERTPDLYVAAMVAVFRQVWRVLADDGTLWLNLGDAYATSNAGRDGHKSRGNASPHGRADDHNGRGTPKRAGSNRAQRGDGNYGENYGPMMQPNRRPIDGLRPKNLIGLPWRVALALQADGWILRSEIIWHKPAPMPESVRDRPTRTHEHLFLLVKNERYYYDGAAIREPVTGSTHARIKQNLEAQRGSDRANGGTRADRPMKPVVDRGVSGPRPAGWAHDGEHTSTAHNQPGVHPKAKGQRAGRKNKANESFSAAITQPVTTRNKRTVWSVAGAPYSGAHFAVFPPKLIEPCILAGSARGDCVLDPFGGAGTTGLVADRLGRDAVLIELNAEYAALARARIYDDAPLFG